MDKFHISSTGLSMNYMPHYLAQELGYFKDVDLEVTFSVPTPWGIVLDDLNSGKAQAVEGGIWVPMMYLDRICEYRAFAKTASRCPLVLVAREPVEPFDWKYLEDKKVLVSGGDGASHGLFVTGCAKEGGADLEKVHFIHDFAGPMLYSLFLGGMGDVIVLQPDMAARVAAAGKGHIIADLTEVGGTIPWSVYYSTPQCLEDPRQLAGRFTLALQRATTWLLEHDGGDCAGIIRRNWPKMELQAGVDVINLFRRTGMWSESVEVDRPCLGRWQGFLEDGYVIEKGIPYERFVDTRPYEYAKAHLG